MKSFLKYTCLKASPPSLPIKVLPWQAACKKMLCPVPLPKPPKLSVPINH